MAVFNSVFIKINSVVITIDFQPIIVQIEVTP